MISDNPVISPDFEGDLSLDKFKLSSGKVFDKLRLHYSIYGKLNEQRDNAILACHALTASSRTADWWPQLFGQDNVFDLTKDCVICVNVIGSCYGSTSPRDIDPQTGRMYGEDFPLITVRDWVNSQAKLIEYLQISALKAVIGGSIGGMQALQWAIDHPEKLDNCIIIGVTPLNAMGIALNHIQRQMILNDPHWNEGRYSDDLRPETGLAQARALAMCTYKSPELFDMRFGRNPNRKQEDPHSSLRARYDVGGYLDYQGELLVKRFDPAAYLSIIRTMENFDPQIGYPSEAAAFKRIKARVLLIGISTDWLYPAEEVQMLYKKMRKAGVNVEYGYQVSDHGHDAFLAEAENLVPMIKKILDEAAQQDSGELRKAANS